MSTSSRPPGLRERKKAQTRQLIAETARRLFAERGFEAVRVSEVAEAADVSDATVFNYFPSKEDLFYSGLEAFEEELLSAIRDREPGESVLDAFARFVLTPRGLLASTDPEAEEQLSSITPAVEGRPALLGRGQQVFGVDHPRDRGEPGAAGARAAYLRGLHVLPRAPRRGGDGREGGRRRAVGRR